MGKKHIPDYKGRFFSILSQTDRSQVGVMTIEPESDSGPEETHGDSDQIVYIIEGNARVEIDHTPIEMYPGDIATIPAGSQHHIYNTGAEKLFFLTIYAPPEY